MTGDTMIKLMMIISLITMSIATVSSGAYLFSDDDTLTNRIARFITILSGLLCVATLTIAGVYGIWYS